MGRREPTHEPACLFLQEVFIVIDIATTTYPTNMTSLLSDRPDHDKAGWHLLSVVPRMIAEETTLTALAQRSRPILIDLIDASIRQSD
jgi:hypothetical protein